jgi:hypothetical protein
MVAIAKVKERGKGQRSKKMRKSVSTLKLLKELGIDTQ